jgi:uncharacterized tellurite resistance protein B-like protein
MLALAWGLVGRTLTVFEVLLTTSAVGAVIATLTWAIAPGEFKNATPTVDTRDESQYRSGGQESQRANNPPPLPRTTAAQPQSGTRRQSSNRPPLMNSSKATGSDAPIQADQLGESIAKVYERYQKRMSEIQKKTADAGSRVQSDQTSGLPARTSVAQQTTVRTATLVPPIPMTTPEPTMAPRVVAPIRAPIRWHGKGESIAIGRYVINDAMVYTREGMPIQDEASCIDIGIEVGTPVREAAGSMGYYPTYARITPNQRANYLSWLSSGRSAPLNEIGYAFLFFYGLERRLLVEQQDVSPVVKEVVRLLETYTFSGSFDGYLSRFLAFVLARGGIETLKDKWFDSIFDRSRLQRDEDFLAVALAWFYKRNAPLPVRWALRIARQDPRCPRSVVLDRAPDHFRSLFEKRYAEKFGEGLILKVSKRDRAFRYHPASPSLLPTAVLSNPISEPILIPNVLGIQSQFSSLVSIWAGCIDELRPFSRVAAKGPQAETREAFEALPDRLKTSVEHPDKPVWDRIVADHTNEEGFALVEIAKLASIHGIQERARLTPKQSDALARTAQYVGLIIEPDPRINNRPYGWNDLVSLLRPEEKHTQQAESRYPGAALLLELGIYIAAADGKIEDVEVDQIARFLESQFLLDPPDARRLEALKRVLVASPPSITGIGKRLQATLTNKQRVAVGQFLVGIAAANGNIDRKEVSALRTAYRALDIDVDQLNKWLESSRLESQEPIEVQRGDETPARGEAIPPRTHKPTSTGFKLDPKLLSNLMEETQKVAIMLGQAMLEHEDSPADENPTQPTSRPDPPRDPRFGNLDPSLQKIVTVLLTRPTCPRHDFNSIARAANWMPDGALDAINEWAFESFDDPIILEHGENLKIQPHLLESPK